MCCVFDWGGSSNAFGIFSCYDDRRNRWASGWAEEIRTTAHCQELSGMRKCSMHARPPLMSNDDIRSCPLAGIHLAQKASLRFVRGQQFNVVPRIVREARFDRHRPTAPRPSRRKTVFRTPLAHLILVYRLGLCSVSVRWRQRRSRSRWAAASQRCT